MKSFNKVDTSKKDESNAASLIVEKVIYCLMVLIFITVFSSQAFASQSAENIAHLTAHSQGVQKADGVSSEIIAKQIKQKAKRTDTTPSNKKITRQEKIASKQKARKNTVTPIARASFHDFAIYSASTKLFDDEDGDGYYNTFGVLFDADVLTNDPNHEVPVYAEIYLSEDGGPWVHLYTTETFSIFGDSSDDEYEVISHLTDGYQPEHYNVLIDLYEPGYSGIVATISSDDTDQLYALPLESQDYEQEYIEYHDEHGGSSSSLALLMLILTLWVRKAK